MNEAVEEIKRMSKEEFEAWKKEVDKDRAANIEWCKKQVVRAEKHIKWAQEQKESAEKNLQDAEEALKSWREN
jgi:hypothetical protein